MMQGVHTWNAFFSIKFNVLFQRKLTLKSNLFVLSFQFPTFLVMNCIFYHNI